MWEVLAVPVRLSLVQLSIAPGRVIFVLRPAADPPQKHREPSRGGAGYVTVDNFEFLCCACVSRRGGWPNPRPCLSERDSSFKLECRPSGKANMVQFALDSSGGVRSVSGLS